MIVYILQLELDQHSEMLYKITDNDQVIINNFNIKVIKVIEPRGILVIAHRWEEPKEAGWLHAK